MMMMMKTKTSKNLVRAKRKKEPNRTYIYIRLFQKRRKEHN